MEIRRVHKDELNTVLSIIQKTIKDIYPHYYSKGAVDFFLSHHNELTVLKDIMSKDVFILYHGKIAVGTLTVKDNEMSRLFVLKKYQGQGYGRILIHYAEEIISKHHSTIVCDSSLMAKDIYLKKGYRIKESLSLSTSQGDYLCYDVMEKNFYTQSKFNYDGKIFVVKENTNNGEVTSQTVFKYHQKGDMIWAEYEGGNIIKGFLLGTVNLDGCLSFSYQHLNNQYEMKMGTCFSLPRILDDGRVELHENWQWLNGDQSKGTSLIIEK